MNSKNLVLLVISLLSALSAACVNETGSDPYSKVAAVCKTQDPLMGQYLALTPELLVETYLSKECQAALESVIPYDDDSFATAPTGMKDKVTEAFQAIIAYPLAVDPSDSKYLGTQPPLAGAIPLFFTDIYAQWDNPNQSLFNYILNHTDLIKYGGPNTDIDAQYVPAFSTHPRQITIFSDFWDASQAVEGFRDAFIRASTLAHEARHGDSILHDYCDSSMTGSSGFECDNELQGAYGFAGTYLKYLIHGGASCTGIGCKPILSDFSVSVAGWYMCSIARERLNRRYPELDALVGGPALPLPGDFCGTMVNYDWIMKQEGITPPPPATSSTGEEAQHARTMSSYGPGHSPRCNYH